MEWLYWDREARWTGFYWVTEDRCSDYTGTGRIDGLITLGQGGYTNWLYWGRNDRWTGYTGER